MQEINVKSSILENIKGKGIVMQRVYNNTEDALSLVKEVIYELADEYNEEIKKFSDDEYLKLKVADRGDKDISISVASDFLLFSMNTTVFQFNREHEIWNNPYVMISPINAFSGMITIYNFLADSFDYNRMEDLGYLVGRIFINQENHLMVEGKRQIGFKQVDFQKTVVSKACLRTIVETAINYALNFDPLVPLYDNISVVSVAQMNEKSVNKKMRTGKRLGFRFNSDDVK